MPQAIRGQLFDLGIYPVAVPGPEGQVWGEVYRTESPREVLAALDDIEGYRADDPDKSLYARAITDVTMPDGRLEQAWVYFYNAPLGRARNRGRQRERRRPEGRFVPPVSRDRLASDQRAEHHFTPQETCAACRHDSAITVKKAFPLCRQSPRR